MLTENCFQFIKVVKRLYVHAILSTRDDGTVTLQTKVLLKLSATSKVLQVQKRSAAHPTPAAVSPFINSKRPRLLQTLETS